MEVRRLPMRWDTALSMRNSWLKLMRLVGELSSEWQNTSRTLSIEDTPSIATYRYLSLPTTARDVRARHRQRTPNLRPDQLPSPASTPPPSPQNPAPLQMATVHPIPPQSTHDCSCAKRGIYPFSGPGSPPQCGSIMDRIRPFYEKTRSSISPAAFPTSRSRFAPSQTQECRSPRSPESTKFDYHKIQIICQHSSLRATTFTAARQAVKPIRWVKGGKESDSFHKKWR